MAKENTNHEEEGPLKIAVFAGQRTEKLAEPLTRTEEDVIVVSNTSDSLIKRTIWAAKNGQRIFREHDIDVIIGDHAGIMSFVAALQGAIFRTPFVLRLGGNIWSINREKLREHWLSKNYRGLILIALFMTMNRVTFILCSGYLAISRTVEDAIVENTSTERSNVGRIGVPLDVESIANAEPSIPSPPSDVGEDQLLVTVTNLRFRGKYEALRDSLPIIEQVLAEHEEIQYVIAGDGAYLESLRRDVDTIFTDDIRERVHLPGFVNNVEGLYTAANAMVYVSYAEGFGNIVQEAMAAGCPVVANDCEGLGEQIDQSETGFLVSSPADPDLSDAIERALFDPDRSRIIENAQQYVRKAGDPESIGNEIVSELRRLLK